MATVSHARGRGPGLYRGLAIHPRASRHAPAQKHLRCTIVGPDSSYSALEIHICWKVLSEERMDPPIHTEYFRSGGAITLIFIVEGASDVSSFVMRPQGPLRQCRAFGRHDDVQWYRR